MPEPTKDPLLSISKTILDILYAIQIFAIALVAVGTVAMLTVQKTEIADKVAAAGLPAHTYWELLAAVAAIGVALYIGLRFIGDLRAIVTSVDEGDPFIAGNAARLRRMGWYALAIQLIVIPIAGMSADIGSITDVKYTQVHASGAGFAMALTLFVLARVFTIGTEMRAELEGTV